MKSGRLESTTDRYTRPALERSPDAGELDVRRVEALNAIEGDRKRSVRQEMREADPQDQAALAATQAGHPDAREVLEQVASLPPDKRALLTRPALPDGFCVVDEKA
jgi:hypothetical protein